MLRWDVSRLLSIGYELYCLPNATASGYLLLSSASTELKEQALVLKGQPLRPSEIPRPPWLTSWMLRPRLGCVGQYATDVDEPAQVWKPGSAATRLCAWSNVASLASGLWWRRLQAPTAQEGASSGADPTSRLPRCQSNRVVCLLGRSLYMHSLPAHLPSVWEAKQPTCFSLQHHFQGTIFTCSVQTQNKTPPHMLFIRRNHTWAEVWGLTQKVQRVLPSGSPRAGLLEAPLWVMATAQEKQSCCGDNLTLVKLQRTKSILQIEVILKKSFLTVIPGGSKEKRGNSLSLSSYLTSFGVGSVGVSADTNFCDEATAGHTWSVGGETKVILILILIFCCCFIFWSGHGFHSGKVLIGDRWKKERARSFIYFLIDHEKKLRVVKPTNFL